MKIVLITFVVLFVGINAFAQNSAQNDTLTVAINKDGNVLWKQESKSFEHLHLNLNSANKLEWKKTFTSNLDAPDLFMKLISTGYFKDFYIHDGQFSGSFNGIFPDFMKMGISQFDMPRYLVYSVINGGIKVEVLEGEFTVTISQLILQRTTEYGTFKIGERTKLETQAFRRGKLSPAFMESYGKIIDFTFDQLIGNLIEPTVSVDNELSSR